MSGPGPGPGTSETFMAREVAEVPEVAGPLCGGWTEAERVASELRARSFPFAVICGRGSSGHAGVYLRYLIETLCGLAVSASAPSVVTSYCRSPRMNGALFITISQSGRSPDLIAATRAARQGGALTLAIVNDVASPAAIAADLVLPIEAGPEQAVAATKTVVNSLVASARTTHATTVMTSIQGFIGPPHSSSRAQLKAKDQLVLVPLWKRDHQAARGSSLS